MFKNLFKKRQPSPPPLDDRPFGRRPAEKPYTIALWAGIPARCLAYTIRLEINALGGGNPSPKLSPVNTNEITIVCWALDRSFGPTCLFYGQYDFRIPLVSYNGLASAIGQDLAAIINGRVVNGKTLFKGLLCPQIFTKRGTHYGVDFWASHIEDGYRWRLLWQLKKLRISFEAWEINPELYRRSFPPGWTKKKS